MPAAAQTPRDKASRGRMGKASKTDDNFAKSLAKERPRSKPVKKEKTSKPPEDYAQLHKSHLEAFKPLRGKKLKVTSKKAEEIVNFSLADFWDSAWSICAERFFVTLAPTVVSTELRNVWLRIAEAEWQDKDMHETPAFKNQRIFQCDEPPLPLAFDTWSRGAVELLPKHRRESVMDPFIRDCDAKGKPLHAAVNTNPVPATGAGDAPKN